MFVGPPGADIGGGTKSRLKTPLVECSCSNLIGRWPVRDGVSYRGVRKRARLFSPTLSLQVFGVRKSFALRTHENVQEQRDAEETTQRSSNTPPPPALEFAKPSLMIFYYCPFELAQIATLSRNLESLLTDYLSLWDLTRNNIAYGSSPQLPPPPTVQAAGNYSNLAYSLWLFCGGPCSVCSSPTMASPACFFLRSRVCSVKCAKVLPTRQTESLTWHHTSVWGSWLPRIPSQPGVSTILRLTFSTRQIDRAEREHHHAYLVDIGKAKPTDEFRPRTSSELAAEWALRAQSLPALQQNAERLTACVKTMAANKGVKVRLIMRCPTMARVFNAFNRDLATITHAVWFHLVPIISAAVQLMLLGTFSPEVRIRPYDRIRCPHCPKILRTSGMAAHVLDKHIQKNPDAQGLTPGALDIARTVLTRSECSRNTDY
ncbi:hypothetical protein C8R44DRAFT_746842 [Mycena epipterygia]|nr:hypothetical protein C8R44DRAFT_746842 [Mycena epipterygia]